MRGAVLLLVLCACAQRPQVPILVHHSISLKGDGFAIAPGRFAAELDALAGSGCRTVSFHEWLEGKPLPPRPVILTFDDGYEDAYTTALPELRARGMVGTFFVVTGWIGADAVHRVVREEAGVTRRYLVWPEVEALSAAGMEIGSHGEQHRPLSHIPEAEAREEAVESRRKLESRLHRPVEVFAYPFGASRQELKAVLREAGYRAAVSGSVHGGADRYELFRKVVYTATPVEEVLRAAAR
jgi:peptidoglycan/xylan/chitin deacetylase (PgdA/CDA1 family)